MHGKLDEHTGREEDGMTSNAPRGSVRPSVPSFFCLRKKTNKYKQSLFCSVLCSNQVHLNMFFNILVASFLAISLFASGFGTHIID